MANLAKEDFKKGKERLKKHFGNLRASGNGSEKSTDVTDTMEAMMPSFAKEVYETRRGMKQDSYGNMLQPYNISLSQALDVYFGISSGKKGVEKDVDILGQFFKSMQVYPKQMNFNQIARRFGHDSLSAASMSELLIDHSSFNNPMEVGNIQSDYRFIIPELFTTAIRTGYEHASMHENWISGTQNMGQQTLTMPQILRGDGMPSKIAEGADIPMGSVRFGKKQVNIFKVGTGFRITDELLMASTLDLIFIFLGEVGNDMSIGSDALGMKVLVEGEQPSLAESAPVIGVEDTADGFTHLDIDRPLTRMGRLKKNVTRIIASEGDALADLNATNANRDRQLLSQYTNVPVDTWVLPEDQMMFLNANRAMVKLQYGGFKTEKRRNPKNQTEELFITDWINFAIINRDARVLVDKSVAYAGNGFPAFMDIDSRIAEAFKEF